MPGGVSAVIILKEIHASRLNVAGMKRVMSGIAQKISAEIELDYLYTTGTWKRNVKFVRQLQIGPDTIQILVGTDDPIYGYVDQGTKGPYPIPKASNTGAKTLYFQPAYTAKTVPGLISSRGGGPSGPFISRKSVTHPGIKARGFSKAIKKKWDKKFKREVEKGMAAIAKASGHAITK